VTQVDACYNADQLSQIGHHNGLQLSANSAGGQLNNVGKKANIIINLESAFVVKQFHHHALTFPSSFCFTTSLTAFLCITAKKAILIIKKRLFM